MLSENKPPRQKSCHACSWAKTKCDLKVPCSRCSARKSSCVYAGKAGASTIPPNAYQRLPSSSHVQLQRQQDGNQGVFSPTESIWGWSWDATGHPTDLPQDIYSISQPLSHNPKPNFQGLLDDQDPAGLLNIPSAVTIDPLSTGHSGSPALMSGTLFTVTETDRLLAQQRDEWVFNEGAQESTESDAMSQSHSASSQEAKELQTVSQTRSTSPGSLLVARVYPDSCRLFIASVLRCYPSLLSQRGSIPTLMHCVGSEFVDTNEHRPILSGNHEAYLSEPLAICSNIAGMFCARSPNTMAFLWRTVDAEQLRLREQVSQHWCPMISFQSMPLMVLSMDIGTSILPR